LLVSEMAFLRDYWHPVATAADVRASQGAPRRVRLFGQEYVLWQAEGSEPAMSDPYCPHRAADLATGWIDGRDLVCPYHGWRFDDAGACTHIPQLDAGLPVPPKAKLHTYPVLERYGVLWTCVGTPVSDGPPRWAEAEEGGWRLYVEFFEQWNVAAPRIIDNNLDQSHLAYVHRTTFGDPDDAVLPHYGVEPTPGGGFTARIPQEQKGIGLQMGVTDDETQRFERIGEIELFAPLTTRTRIYYGGTGPDYCFYGAATPVDDQHSIYMRLTALSGTEEEQPFEPFTSFGRRVKEEDRIVLEATYPDFSLDITSEVHLRCDKSTLEYRKYLARLHDAQQEQRVTIGAGR
jgi:phenylpropionate dioxygenase-like ring-hydroxylating dioxygenase large terminal subunit